MLSCAPEFKFSCCSLWRIYKETEAAEQPEMLEYLSTRFPHVVAIAMDAATRNPSGSCETQSEFDFTLDLMLDAFERLHAAGWVSRELPAGASRSPADAQAAP